MRNAMLLPGCAALVLSACTNHIGTQIGSTPALVTDADVRVITDRPSPFDPTNPARRAVCTEPSPDVAKALATALTLSASASVPGGPTGSGSLNSQTAEGILELAGRVPAVVALRDGTYQLCQAWANGAVGDSAYALALGRYDQLLVTLMLGEDMVAAYRSPPEQLVAQVTPPAGGGQNNGGQNNGSQNIGAGAAQKASQQSSPNPSPQLVRDDPNRDGKFVQLASLEPMFANAAAQNPPAGAAPNPAAPPPAAPKPAAVAAAKPAANPAAGAQQGTGTQPPSPDNTALVQALGQLQKNYMTLGAVGPLMVACIEAGDTSMPQRMAMRDGSANALLTTSVCQKLLENVVAAIPTASGPSGPQNVAGR